MYRLERQWNSSLSFFCNNSAEEFGKNTRTKKRRLSRGEIISFSLLWSKSAETNEVVYIGTDLPDEYAHSEYTHILKGANEKAKANAAQGLPELIITATNMEHTDNSKAKHKKDAKYGWYKYESRFALPVFAGDGEVERYNVFHVAMILRHDKDGMKYLYDIMNIKKETSDLFQSEDLTQ